MLLPNLKVHQLSDTKNPHSLMQIFISLHPLTQRKNCTDIKIARFPCYPYRGSSALLPILVLINKNINIHMYTYMLVLALTFLLVMAVV